MPAKKPPNASTSAAASAPCLLAVDDEEDILFSLRETFATLLPRVRVLTTASPKEALEILKKERVDVILSDFRMPEMDGIELLKQARTLAPQAKRMMITAYPDPDLARRASIEAGVSVVIAKPFDLEVIVGAADFLLETRRG